MPKPRTPFVATAIMARPVGGQHTFVTDANGMCQRTRVRWGCPELLILNPGLNLPPSTVALRELRDEVLPVLEIVSTSESVEALKARELELLVAANLEADGYVSYVTPRTRDGGRDVLAVRPGAQPYIIIAEAKCGRIVGPDAAQRLESVRRRDGARRALLVTTGTFSTATREEVAWHWRHTLRLVDGCALVRWTQEHLRARRHRAVKFG